jgi:hypothetical protein
VIYAREAHPIEDRPMHYSYDAAGNPIEQPDSYQARLELAAKTIDEANLEITVLVDEIDNPVYCSYGQRPNNAFLIGMDGIVRLVQAWNDPLEMEAAILDYLNESN